VKRDVSFGLFQPESYYHGAMRLATPFCYGIAVLQPDLGIWLAAGEMSSAGGRPQPSAAYLKKLYYHDSISAIVPPHVRLSGLKCWPS